MKMVFKSNLLIMNLLQFNYHDLSLIVFYSFFANRFTKHIFHIVMKLISLK